MASYSCASRTRSIMSKCSKTENKLLTSGLSLENAPIFEQLIQDEFYEKLFPDVSQFELASRKKLKWTKKQKAKTTTTKTTTSNDASTITVQSETNAPLNVRMFVFGSNKSAIDVRDIQIADLVISTVMSVLILYTLRFFLRRTSLIMGCLNRAVVQK